MATMRRQTREMEGSHVSRCNGEWAIVSEIHSKFSPSASPEPGIMQHNYPLLQHGVPCTSRLPGNFDIIFKINNPVVF